MPARTYQGCRLEAAIQTEPSLRKAGQPPQARPSALVDAWSTSWMSRPGRKKCSSNLDNSHRATRPQTHSTINQTTPFLGSKHTARSTSLTRSSAQPRPASAKSSWLYLATDCHYRRTELQALPPSSPDHAGFPLAVRTIVCAMPSIIIASSSILAMCLARPV